MPGENKLMALTVSVINGICHGVIIFVVLYVSYRLFGIPLCTP